MKLDDLRARLRADKRALKKKKPKARAAREALVLAGWCAKCRMPREPANLTDPDVAEIIRESEGTTPFDESRATHAFRCRECRIIWLAGPLGSSAGIEQGDTE